MLKLHEFLHRKATVQCLLVVILACLDSTQWLPDLAEGAAALEAVFEVLRNDYGFEEDAERDEAQQGQEAAWAVLAAVSKHVANNGVISEVTLTAQVSRPSSTLCGPPSSVDTKAVCTGKKVKSAVHGSC